MALSYEKAGVSIDVADAAKKQMAEAMGETGGAGGERGGAKGGRDGRILHRAGAFASLFEATFPGVKEPVLVMKTEEPGSKQKIVFQHAGRMVADGRGGVKRAGVGSIGKDMIHHLIDDIIVVGARPLMVQDCIVCGKLQKEVVLELVESIAEACRENGCSLTGGETSEQPGVLEAGLYILSSSIVGVVEKSKMVDGSAIVEGDVVVAVPSNGLHTNGYSLVRALMAERAGLMDEKIAAVGGGEETFLEAILRPHTCYFLAFEGLFLDNCGGGLHGVAHITGGGIGGNLNRILPGGAGGVDAVVDASRLRVLPLFKRIRELGGVPEGDMMRTFNLGIGMTIVCARGVVERIVRHLGEFGMGAYEIGRIVGGGSGVVRTEGAVKW